MDWIAPAAALAAHRRGEFPLSGVTRQILESLDPFTTVAALRSHAALQPAGPPTIRPRLARRPDGSGQTITPEHPLYAEAMRIDPDGSGTVAAVLTPGVAARLMPTVQRLPAPGLRNSYVVGREGRFVVIDPGPDVDSHVQALMAATGGCIEALLVTHGEGATAAARLSALTGAPHISQPSDGERLALAGCTLQALHHPGHAAQLCWLLEEERLLFTGDAVEPLPDIAAAFDHFAPGQGFLVARPA